MSHIPLNPDEVVPPHMHGFDPLPKANAIDLVHKFVSPVPYIKFPSFYFDAATLTALLQAERNQCTYDGFFIYFGLDESNELLLLIHRVKVKESSENCAPYKFKDIPQRVAVELPSTNEIEVIDFAIKPTNKDGFAQLYRIKKDGSKYNTYRSQYQKVFGQNQSVNKVSSQTSSFSQKNQLTQNLITGYYIGWGILDLIRKELASKVGIKLFLGYGNLSLTISSIKCVHIVAIASDNPMSTLDTYPLPTVWSTQDQTKLEYYLLDNEKSNTPVALAALRIVVGTLGSSCAFALHDTV